MESFVSECTLNKFFKRRQDHLFMFGFICGVRKTLPSVGIRNIIRQYLDTFNLDGDIPAMETVYNRMMDELREVEKTG